MGYDSRDGEALTPTPSTRQPVIRAFPERLRAPSTPPMRHATQRMQVPYGDRFASFVDAKFVGDCAPVPEVVALDATP